MTYTLTPDPDTVVRDADAAHIPNHPDNADWQAYQAWLADGGVPNPYVPPPLPPPQGQPACSVYSSTEQDIPANTPTRIMFDTAEYDVTHAFDLDNNRFQPTVDGYYQVNCGCGVAAGAVQNFTSLYKNGVEYRRSTTSNEGGNTRLSTLVHLNGTTDYVEGFVRVNKSFSTIPGGVLTSFSAALVQPS
jgi:hypothetical protein